MVDCSGVRGSVLMVDCRVLRALKASGRVRVLGTTGKSVQDSARIGFDLLRHYSPILAELEVDIRADTLNGESDRLPVSGGSAGQTILLAMISSPVGELFDARVCATGVLNISGGAGPVGGIQPRNGAAKLDAAWFNGFKKCLIPQVAMEELTRDFPDYIEMSEGYSCRIIGCRDWFDYARYAFSGIPT